MDLYDNRGEGEGMKKITRRKQRQEAERQNAEKAALPEKRAPEHEPEPWE